MSFCVYQGRNQRGAQQTGEEQVGLHFSAASSPLFFNCYIWLLLLIQTVWCQASTLEGVLRDAEEKHPQRRGEEDLQSERAEERFEIHPGELLLSHFF